MDNLLYYILIIIIVTVFSSSITFTALFYRFLFPFHIVVNSPLRNLVIFYGYFSIIFCQSLLSFLDPIPVRNRSIVEIVECVQVASDDPSRLVVNPS